MTILVLNPYQTIFGLDGLGLNGGKLYIGVANQDPQTNPQQVYWDAAATIPAAQPLDVMGGYITRLGTPARAFVNAAYSVRVLDRFGVLVFYAPNVSSSAEIISALGYTPANKAGDTFTGDIGVSGTAAVNRSVLFRTGASMRWAIGAGGGPENFFIARYDNGGNFIDIPLAIDRVTANVTLTGGLSVAGQVTLAAGANVTGGVLNVNSQRVARVVSGGATNSGIISWGTGAPATLDEGQIYLRHA